MASYRILHPRKYSGVKRDRFEIVSDKELPDWAIPSLVRSGFIEPFDLEPDLSKLKKAELLEYAAEQGVEVPAGSKVDEIRTLLKEVN